MLAETIFEQRAPNLPIGAVADILDGLIWTTADNGSGICDCLRMWMHSDDPTRVAEALELKNVFLWNSRDEILGDIERIRVHHPALVPKIEVRLAAWDRQNKTNNNGDNTGRQATASPSPAP